MVSRYKRPTANANKKSFRANARSTIQRAQIKAFPTPPRGGNNETGKVPALRLGVWRLIALGYVFEKALSLMGQKRRPGFARCCEVVDVLNIAL